MATASTPPQQGPTPSGTGVQGDRRSPVSCQADGPISSPLYLGLQGVLELGASRGAALHRRRGSTLDYRESDRGGLRRRSWKPFVDARSSRDRVAENAH